MDLSLNVYVYRATRPNPKHMVYSYIYSDTTLKGI